MKRILFVCTGNTCRSPMAEGLAKALFNNKGVFFASAGLCAAEGAPASHNAAAAMWELDIDITHHRARPVTAEDIEFSDLILCMSNSHRLQLLGLGASSAQVRLLGSGVPDPFGGDIETYRRCRDCIKNQLDALEIYPQNQEIICAERSHAAGIAALEKTVFAHPWSEEMVESAMEGGTRYLLALCNNKVIGFAGVKVVLDEGQVANIAVHPLFRKQGLGKRLTEKMLEFCREQNCAAVTLEVRQSNIPAINLYRSLGFSEVGLRKNYYRDPEEDAVLMTLYL